MRTRDKQAARALLPVFFALIFALSGSVALSLALQLADARPRIGDIIAFAPSVGRLAGHDIRLLVQRPNQYGCVIDLAVIRNAVGSLVVETETGGAAKTFRMHWAGVRTSTDTADCGASTDLIVDQHDLDLLAVAARD